MYGKPGGQKWKAGDTLVLKDLARTLRVVAEKGADAFYAGELAELLEKEMKAEGGLITRADLAAYKANERKPIRTTFRGFDVYGPPPPSSGGVALAEMLNILETFDLKKHSRFSPENTHLMIEAMRRAYADRARPLGDPHDRVASWVLGSDVTETATSARGYPRCASSPRTRSPAALATRWNIRW